MGRVRLKDRSSCTPCRSCLVGHAEVPSMVVETRDDRTCWMACCIRGGQTAKGEAFEAK